MTSHVKKPAVPDGPSTWQQQKTFEGEQPKQGRRKRKAFKPAPAELEATAKPRETSPASHTRTAVQPVPQISSGPLKGRRKARTGASTHYSRQSIKSKSPLPVQLVKAAKKPRSTHDRRTPHSNRTPAEMAPQLSGVLVPPHLRKRAAASTQPKATVRLGDCIAITTPPASERSQVEELIQSQVSPNEDVTQVVQDAQNVQDVQDHTPPTPAATTEGRPKQSGDFEGWDQPVPEQHPTPSKRKENPRWPRATKTPKGKHVWLKSREIPKDLSCGSQSDGGVAFKSESDGDPSYDVKKLMDWNGDWLPPPEEWAARKGFTHRHFGQAIEQWANEHSRHCTGLMSIDSPAFSGVKTADGGWLNKDLVPRYWLHKSIDNTAPREFWGELSQRAPAPLTDVDIMEDPPYWERWEDGEPDNCFMTTLVVPEARINMNDHENELERASAMLSMNERMERFNKAKANKEHRSEAKQTRPVAVSLRGGARLPDRRLHPKANIYLRPVQPADIRGIMTIYNHYVKNTVHAAELDEQTEAQIRSWIDAIVQAGLPCLVAVAKRNQRKGPQGYVSETIVGLVHLEEYMSLSSMYRYTFELALYVHPGYVRQGIGKCLLDQMMYMANTGYNKMGGYEWVNDFEYLKNGKGRTIKTILVGVHYARGDEIDWIVDYFGEFGFKKAGRLTQVGYKVGKVVDKILFQLHTTEVIDPQSIFTVPA